FVYIHSGPAGPSALPLHDALPIWSLPPNLYTTQSSLLPTISIGKRFPEIVRRSWGGGLFFCRKKMSERSELFFQRKINHHPATRPHNSKATMNLTPNHGKIPRHPN